MYITVKELLSFTDAERSRWEQWFRSEGEQILDMPLTGEGHASTGRLILHVFGTELSLVEGLRRDKVTDYRGLPAMSVETVFGFGLKTRRNMRDYIFSLGSDDWEKTIEWERNGQNVRASIRKVVLHALLHEIRHWAQIAAIMRDRGLVPPGAHDLMDSDVLS